MGTKNALRTPRSRTKKIEKQTIGKASCASREKERHNGHQGKKRTERKNGSGREWH